MSSKLSQKIETINRILNNPDFDLETEKTTLITTLSEIVEIDQERELLIRKISQNQEHIYLVAISRVHDGPLQTLPAIAMKCEATIRNSTNINVIRNTTLELINQVNVSIQEIRSILLYQESELEIETELITLLRSNIRKSNIRARLNIPNAEDMDMIQSGAARLIGGFIQEALKNAQKHGGATDAIVSVFKEGSHIIVEVEDNGTGFTGKVPMNYEDLQAYADRGHLGLRIIGGMAQKYNGGLCFDAKGSSLGGALAKLDLTLPNFENKGNNYGNN